MYKLLGNQDILFLADYSEFLLKKLPVFPQ